MKTRGSHYFPRDDGSRANSAPRAAIEAAAAEWFARRDAGLSAEQDDALRLWLAESPRHAEAFSRLDSAWSTFGKPSDAGAADLLLAELAARRSKRRWRQNVVACAALALGGLGFGVVQNRTRDSAISAGAVAVMHRPDQRVLADGSMITLRDGAEISVAYTSEMRRVTLRRGEALFEVEKDHARPFVVSANGIDVRAVGTAFTVQLSQATVDVLVTEGTVSVGATAESAPIVTAGAASAAVETRGGSPLFVSAGNRIVVTTSPAPQPVETEVVPSMEMERRLSWRSPRVEFSGMPLVEAVALMNREAVGRTSPRLRIADRELEPKRVSGVFRTDNIEAFVLILEAGFGVRIERTGDTIVLHRATPDSN